MENCVFSVYLLLLEQNCLLEYEIQLLRQARRTSVKAVSTTLFHVKDRLTTFSQVKQVKANMKILLVKCVENYYL